MCPWGWTKTGCIYLPTVVNYKPALFTSMFTWADSFYFPFFAVELCFSWWNRETTHSSQPPVSDSTKKTAWLPEANKMPWSLVYLKTFFLPNFGSGRKEIKEAKQSEIMLSSNLFGGCTCAGTVWLLRKKKVAGKDVKSWS